MVAVGAGLAFLLRLGIGRIGLLGRPVWRGLIVLAAAVAIALTFRVAMANWLVFGVLIARQDLAVLFGATAMITAAMTTLATLIGHAVAAEDELRLTSVGLSAAGVLAPSPVPRARFLDRLPAKLAGSELYAVEAEDHYLRLHTSKGQDLILMRLGDAIAELEGLEGGQVHRSFGVARQAVAEVVRDGAKVQLRLTSGLLAPVSRSNLKLLKQAGWL